MQDTTQAKVRVLPTTTLVLHNECIIDRPVKEVWPLLFKYNQWNPQHIGAKVIRVAGKPDQEGEIILEYKKDGDGYSPPIVIEIVKIIPYRKLVWKLYEPQETPESLGVSFVDFSLNDLGNRTGFVYNSYSEILKEKLTEMPSEEEFKKTVAEIHEALKRHIESR